MVLRDPVSSASHLLTAAWAVYATLLLVRLTRAGDGRRLAVGVYGLSMVLLYLASGTFHGLFYATPDERRFFQKLDQSAIFLLIAGTSTPILATLLAGRMRRSFLYLVWGLALAGIGWLWLLPKAPHAVSVVLYLVIGWASILPVAHYVRAVGWRAMNWVWAGAAVYTAGAVCELAEWPAGWEWPVRFGFHEVLLLCDPGGSVMFFVFVVRHVIPYRRPAAVPPPLRLAA
jgi:hemolysin III